MTYHHIDDVFDRMTYPAGERHIRLADGALAALTGAVSEPVIEFDARCFDDLAQMVTADRLLRRNGVLVTWFVPYFPFARHDRRNDAVDGFELGLAIEMVGEIKIVIADPHSEVAGQLRHIGQKSVVDVFRSAGAFDSDPIVIVPDAGAAKKVDSWVGNADRVQALKHRDPMTGKLSGFEVLADDLDGRPCIIIDDICDAGGTFLGLAAELKAKNAGPLILAVTHGLFTKGLASLGAAFDHIYSFGPADPGSAGPNSAGPDSAEKTSQSVSRIPFQSLYEKGAQQ